MPVPLKYAAHSPSSAPARDARMFWDAVSTLTFGALVVFFLAGVTWNLGTWYLGLPVSSSHTLIGSIIGVGIANSLWNGVGLTGVNWGECKKVGLALLCSPLIGFVLAFILLLVLKLCLRDR